MAMLVGTASARSLGGSVGSPTLSVLTRRRGKRATVQAVPSGLTRRMSLPAASASRTSLDLSAASPNGLVSAGSSTGLLYGSGSAFWYSAMFRMGSGTPLDPTGDSMLSGRGAHIAPRG